MNIITLRKQLAEELREICKDFRLKKPLSDENNDWIESGLTVFEQDVPPPRMDSDFSYHPFIIVKATGGNIAGNNEHNGSIALVIATWDDQDATTGIDNVFSIIERIKNHFLAMPILNSTFYCQENMSYDIDEQANPYWYGTLTMTWEIPKTNLLVGEQYV